MEVIEYTDDGLADAIKTFLATYKDDSGRFIYIDQIDSMLTSNRPYITLDYNSMAFVPELERGFHTNPDRLLKAFAVAIYDALAIRYPKYAKSIRDRIRVRLANYPIHKGLREINADTIGTMVSISGMVVRASEVKPLALRLTFRCIDNHKTVTVKSDNTMAMEAPKVCSNPDCKNTKLTLDQKECEFIDFQILRLQELPEELPPGQMPHYMDVHIKRDLVDNTRPGDRIVLTGIVRLEQEPMRGITQKNSVVYRHRIDGNNIEYLGGRGTKMSRKVEREEISSDEEKIIMQLSRSPDIYEKLVASIAPHITEHEIVKESILLLMVGANQREHADGDKSRGDINIFLVGDPGTAKSELLKFCARTAPRGMYTSGRGSTAAGLTAAVVKDKSGMMMLEAGAVVLGDQGLVCIDEFDKMKPEDSSALHEVMEQQSASIAKGGIVATLNARTSILAAANPTYGRYDTFKTITENVRTPIPLLTRFDLIFVIRDVASPSRDERIAKHILLRHRSSGIPGGRRVDPDILTKYIAYVKRFRPEMTKDAEDAIMKYYLKMRSGDTEGVVNATPRQLEGIVRLATARAKIHMRQRVETEDAERAIFLLTNSLAEAGFDQESGKVDIMVLHGKSKSQMGKVQLFMDIMKSLEGSHKMPIPERDIIEELTKTDKFDQQGARDMFRKLYNEGVLMESKSGHYNTT